MEGSGVAVVLLRGMNTGGVRFPMKDLAAALAAEGFERVRTVLASGNVTLASDLPAQEAADAVLRVVEREFGHRLQAVGVDLGTVQRAVDGYPFERRPDRHAYVVFAEDMATLDAAVRDAGDLDPAVERVAAGDGVLYWDAPKGETLTTAFGKRSSGRRAAVVTTRNLNTLEKILAAAV